MASAGVNDCAHSPHPSVFLLLNLPFGITSGYIVVAVPFLVTRAGLSVLTAASIVGIALTPKAWKVLWSPVADVCLTLKKWYVIGATVAGGMLLLQGLIPITRSTVPLLTFVLFVAELGSSLLSPSLGGLMAEAMPEDLKGRAAGWYQLGGKVGRGFGGGAGLWLAVREGTPAVAGLVLGIACVGCIIGLQFLCEPARTLSGGAVERIVAVFRELLQLIRSRDGALVAVLALSPIGVSGVDNFWSGIAAEWQVSANTVVLVTGFATIAVAALGCLLAGWWADRADRRVVYLATGTLLALACASLGVAPHVPGVFITGTLAHKFVVSMCDVALSALTLSVIGRSTAATKYTVLAGLGNVSEIYMTIVSGWVHDHWSADAMLIVEAVVALLFVCAAALFLMRRGEGQKALANAESP
jgi:PAT family beta-lactamase induction signal transducer AmpG